MSRCHQRVGRVHLGAARLGRPQVDLEAQDPVLETGRGVGQHGVILEVDPGLLEEALALGSFHGGEAATAHRLGAVPETFDHVLGVESVHGAMLGAGPVLGRGRVVSGIDSPSESRGRRPVRARGQ